MEALVIITKIDLANVTTNVVGDLAIVRGKMAPRSRAPMDARFRKAGPGDAALLAPLNAHLIRDEGHRNTMSVPQLAERMAKWLRGEYRAVVFESAGAVVGYALYREEPDHVYLRQFFVAPGQRRRGIGRGALDWMWAHAWRGERRLRIDVLAGNANGIAFWRGVGLKDYCITMEMERPSTTAVKAR